MLTIAKAVGELLMPLSIVIALLIIGLSLRHWRPRAGNVLAWFALSLLVVLSLPSTGNFLRAQIENSTASIGAIDQSLRQRAGAIVVLGGGRARAPEYGGETVSEETAERLRYAVRLHRASGLPLLVTGGAVFGEAVSEGELMQQTLIEDFRVRAAWVEIRSRNTYENALYTRPLLDQAGVPRVLLVTHALHMPRALWAFQQIGIDAIPAPMGYTSGGSGSFLLDLLPSVHGLSLSTGALHEWIGIMWYRVAYADRRA